MANEDKADPQVAEPNGVEAKDEEVKQQAGAKKEEAEQQDEQQQQQPQAEVTDEVKDAVVRQIEYYFGDYNLARDKFMKEQLALDEGGWLPLSVLITFNRLARHTKDPDVIVRCLRQAGSGLVEVSEDGTRVRRAPDRPLPAFDDQFRQELVTRTAYVKGFPADDTFENIAAFMEPHGPLQNLTLRHYHDKALQRTVFKGSIFATFEDVAACRRFVELPEVRYRDIQLQHMWQAQFIEEKRVERDERLARRRGPRTRDGGDAADAQPGAGRKHAPFPRGAILHVARLGSTATREAIRAAVMRLGQVEPAFIMFERGQPDGHVRFADADGAVNFLAKLEGGRLPLDEADPDAAPATCRALQGEEEDTFLADLQQKLAKIRTANRNAGARNAGRGRKRRGTGDAGPRTKSARK